ncbi:hypothetical protein [Thermospira aquatica]|uniref:Pycsar effector protein domain-containing protein n=1 Tax=Thermospira aquatica TaxID=2828656 RepID=A0AAX3BCC3_9SPIR|nr:hypothetical protein [Thermospira aquatica]URA09973.1 hypothetical protein KDW03_10905 [Thermospira aquatica]
MQSNLRYEFVSHVYDAITRQIQQFDVKVSVLLSWDGVIAIMLGREVVLLFSSVKPTLFIYAFLFMSAFFLIISSFFCYKILRPQNKINEKGNGIFWAGDILRLGKNHKERVESYLKVLSQLEKPEDFAEQIIQSVVGISEILMTKNKFFFFGLFATITSFVFLIFLIVRIGLGS